MRGQPPSRLPWPPASTAHRGLHSAARGIVENSASAIEAAASAGWGVELDVQPSADGGVMVFHDFTLDRLTTAQGPIATQSTRALTQLAYRDANEPGERIITLDEAFEIIGGRVPVYVEFKSTFLGQRTLEENAAAALNAYTGPVAVMSFDPASVRCCAALMPGIPRGLVSGPYRGRSWMPEAGGILNRFALRHALFALRMPLHFLNYDVAALATPSIQWLRQRRGLPLFAWTVRNAEDWAAVAAHADVAVFEGEVPERFRGNASL